MKNISDNSVDSTSESEISIVEQSLVEIWRHALHVDTISIKDNFFEIGGDSLLALIAIDQIKQRLGWEIGLGEFLRYPTILELVRNRSEPRAAAANRSMIRMSVRGRKTPSVFIHPVGGMIFGYSKLVKSLGNSRACYGIQSLALAGLEAPKTIEEMADVYSGLIHDELGGSQFNIVGWSSGGIVGFEIARIAAGKNLNLKKLVLIDSYVWKVPFPRLSGKETLREFHADLTSQVPRRRRNEAEEDFDIPDNIFRRLAEVLFGRFASQGENSSEVEFIRRLYEAYRWNMHALSNYRATPADVSCLLLNGTGNDTVDTWKELSRNGFTSESINCGHYGLLEEQHAHQISERISSYIDK